MLGDEAGVDEIEGAALELVGEDVDARDFERTTRERLEVARIEIGRDHASARADPFRQPRAHRSGAGADLEAAPPGTDAETLEQRKGPRVPETRHAEQAFALLLESTSPRAAVVRLNVRQWTQSHPAMAGHPLLGDLAREGATGAAAAPVRAELLALPPGPERQAHLVAHLRAQIARLLRTDAERVDPRRPLADMGFESLMIVELRNRVENSLGLTLSAALVWGHPTIEALALVLARRLGLDAEPDADPEPQAADPLATELAELSEGELAALLSDELASLHEERT